MDAITAGAPQRGIVLYDFLYCRGGAELVTLELARGLGGAAVCFGFRNRQAFPDDALAGLECFDLHVWPRVAGARTFSGMLAYRQRTRFIRAYDWAIFSGYMATEAVYQRPAGLNLYYCHTVPRFAYDLEPWYLSRAARWQQPLIRRVATYVRHRYPRALQRMDLIIANSETVRSRLARFTGLHASVIHPPCDVAGHRWIAQEDYYLSTARLEPHKRVDLVIKAFLRMPGKQLVVMSGGTEAARLRRLADGAPHIVFTGWVDDPKSRDLIGRCIATLYLAKDEDFGLSPVESMAAGKPVIGTAEGGLLETVENGVTGVLVRAEPTVADVVNAVDCLNSARAAAMRSACEARARRFSRERFLVQMKSLIGQPCAGGSTQ